MGIVAWLLFVFFAVAEVWVFSALTMIAMKRVLPHQEAVASRVTLGEVNLPKSKQVFASVTYSIGHAERLLRIAFFGANKERIRSSARYRKITEFYAPGKRFRVYMPPRWSLLEILPECPVLRVETVFLLVSAFVFGCILIGFALTW